MKSLRVLFLLLVLSFGSSQIGLADQNPLEIYIAKDENPATVLSYLLGHFGKEVVGANFSSRPVSGRFEVRSVADVMAYFRRAYNVSYFEYGSKVFLYTPTDWHTERFYVGDYEPSTDWKELLSNAGLYQRAFTVFYSAPKKELMVSAPRSYIALLKDAFEAKRPKEEEASKDANPDSSDGKNQKDKTKEFMVFPLKYASVEDRTIKLRDKTYTTPGVLKVLKTVLGLDSGGASGDMYAQDNLSVLSNPRTAVKAASDLVDQSVRGVKPKNSFYGANTPVLGPDRNTEEHNINIPSGQAQGGDGSPGLISADTRTNSIIIRDSKDKYDYYKAIIDKLDVPVAMIEVQAMLVEIDTTALKQLGTEFGLNGSNIKYRFPGTPISSQAASSIAGVSAVIDPATFVLQLKALESKEHAKVLARPTIVTQDNVPAFIDLSETLYLQLTGERVANVQKVVAGSLLQVTPRVVDTGDGKKIFINVEIQDGALEQKAGDINPRVRNTELSTQAMIDQDKAILIGGYNRETRSTIEHKVPLLSSIPLIGKAFQETEHTTNNYVRLFLIVPKVLSKPLYMVKSTRDALKKIDQQKFDYKAPELKVPQSTELYKMSPKLDLGSELKK